MFHGAIVIMRVGTYDAHTALKHAVLVSLLCVNSDTISIVQASASALCGPISVSDACAFPFCSSLCHCHCARAAPRQCIVVQESSCTAGGGSRSEAHLDHSSMASSRRNIQHSLACDAIRSVHHAASLQQRLHSNGAAEWSRIV